jgi:hypothetical protein
MFSIKRTFTFATIIAMLIATAVIASFNPMVVTGDSTLRYGGPIKFISIHRMAVFSTTANLKSSET